VGQIDFTARKSADLEGRERFAKDSGAGLGIGRGEDCGNRVDKRRKSTGILSLFIEPDVPISHIRLVWVFHFSGAQRFKIVSKSKIKLEIPR
jgi:hypothetical protein